MGRVRVPKALVVTLFFGIVLGSADAASAQTWKIMMVGNSITLGKFSSDSLGFRRPLYEQLTDAQVDFDFVGDTGDSPYEGWFYSGAKIPDFYPPGQYDITNQMNTYQPDLVLVHLGTNDITHDTVIPYSYDNGQNFADTITGRLAYLLAYLAKWKTGEFDTSLKQILVCKIIPREDHMDRTYLFNRELVKIYHDSEAGNIPDIPPGTLTIVDQFSAIDTTTMMLGDGIHPNDDGYQEMANVYFDYTMDYLHQQEGPDTFDRTDLGPAWAASPEYQIQNGELANTSAVDSWNYLAVYKKVRDAREVKFHWASSADEAGIDAGGFAIMLDAANTSADGYLLWRRTSVQRWELYTIEYGQPGHRVAVGDAVLPNPQPGDEMKVIIDTDPNGHHFKCYINGQLDATIDDPNKEQGNAAHYYCGVMLKGNHNNNIDDFDLRMIPDLEFPADITDLTPALVSESSVTLQWTAPGDDGDQGIATRYEIRYSTSQITEENFYQATAVSNPPAPRDAGTLESAVVDSLSPGTTYYFALRTYDDANNPSAISNVVESTTQTEAPKFTYVDDFNRDELGPNWSAHPDYQIQNGELVNTAVATGWNYLATFSAYRNPVEVSFKWASGDQEGVNSSGVAVMLSEPSSTADGYLILRRYNDLTLHPIVNGVAQRETTIDQVTPNVSTYPDVGDVIDVQILSDDTGYHFKVFLNGVLDGQLDDTNPSQQPDYYYAGVMIYGNRNVGIDDFTITVERGDPAEIRIVSGDNQSAGVNQALPESLVVQVKDEYGNPSSGVYVDFSITQGSGYLSTDSLDFDGNVWFEAEDANLIPPVTILDAADASGGKAVATTQDRQGSIKFGLYIPETGTYKLWARVFAPTSTSNSFLGVRMDEGDTLQPDGDQWRFDVTASYEWYTDDILVFSNLTKGYHELYFYCREPDTRLDKILLTNIPGYTPSGTGGEPLVVDNMTNDDGYAWTRLRFTTEAGWVTVHAEAPGVSEAVDFHEYAEPGPPVAIEKYTGDNQTGRAGDPLPDPFVVKVKDEYGNGVPNVNVTFQVMTGGGTLNPASQPVKTDSSGLASVTYTLGYDSETQTVQATAEGVNGTVTFTATASGGIPRQITKVSGDGQTGTVGTQLPDPLVVKIVDGVGDPVEGITVDFNVTAGGGHLDNGQQHYAVDTDVNGEARVFLTLGTAAGDSNNVVQATASLNGEPLNGSPVTFWESATAGDPDTLKYVSGSGQSGPVGLPLEQPFVVRVVDRYGNPKSGQMVTFSVVNGNGNIDGQSSKSVVTDANGLAQVTYTMGSEVGVVNRVQATSTLNGNPLNGSPVTFEATATTGVASKLVYISGNNQTATVGQTLGQPLVVRVTDIFGNPVADHPVRFEVKAGGGKVNGQASVEVRTDAQGTAQVNWTLGTQAGSNAQTVWATSEREGTPLEGSPVVFNANALADAAAKLVEFSGNGQTGQVGKALSHPFVAKVTDQYGNAKEGHLVTFRVIAGGGSFNGQASVSVVTDSLGLARATLTLGTEPGTDNNVAQASASLNGSPLQGSPVTFKASATAGDAHSIAAVSGNGQTGTVGKPLPDSIKVRVTDSYGNGVPGFTVQFEVTQGGGTIGGVESRTVTTNSLGEAAVRWTLGTVAGENNNVLRAVANGLQGSPVVFTASARADSAYKLLSVSGNEQTGPAGSTLPEPLKVRVEDQYGNPVVGYPVHFEVKQGEGNLAGYQTRDILTDVNGVAQVVWTLGPEPGVNNNLVEVSAARNGQPLLGSPVTFVASATVGNPTKLVYLSGQNQTGVVGNPLPEPLKVKVTDELGNGIPDFPVVFEVKAGGGSLENGQTRVTVNTTAAGVAEVHLTLGQQAGQNNNVVDASAEYEGQPLEGSPYTFYASARSSNAAKMQIAGGNAQTGTVGQPLAQALAVKVLDADGNPVQGHPVRFEVLEGGGNFDGETVKVSLSDNAGVARATLTLGTTAGDSNNVVRASSTDGAHPLQGSPLTFWANARPGKADSAHCVVAADPQTLPADGQSRSNITVTVRDAYGNPIPGHAVVLIVSGSGNQVEQPLTTTNAEGKVTGSVASTKAEEKWVTARDVTDAIDLRAGTKVTFTPLGASRIALYAGNAQSANIGTVLPAPLQVKVSDQYDNGIEGYPVTFAVVQGGGTVLTPQPVTTDANGIASVQFALGPNEGLNVVEARAAGLNGSPVTFTLTGVQGTPAAIVAVSGDGQSGRVGQYVHDPLVVKVVDGAGNAVWGVPVTFAAPLGGEPYPAADTTDAYGMAQCFFKLGMTKGTYLVNAEAQGLTSTVTFRLEAKAGEAARLLVHSGQDQVGAVGEPLPSPIVARVTDGFGNGVAGVPVSFEVATGGGTVAGSQPVLTNAEGFASATWTLGPNAGVQTLRIKSDGLEGSPTYVNATATAGTAVELVEISGNHQRGQAGRALGLPLRVQVRDANGNGVPGVQVTFVVTEGGGSLVEPQPVTTDSAGYAEATWILGQNPGRNEAWAIKTGLQGSPIIFEATGEANNYPVISAPSDTTIREDQVLSFTVSATDADGDAVQLGAKQLPRGAVFDSLSTHQFTWKPDFQQAGAYEVIFYARDSKGATSYKRCFITVHNANRAPSITSYFPPENTLSVQHPDSVYFSVGGSDADGDSLIYFWTTETLGQKFVVSHTTTYLFKSTRYMPGMVQITAWVTDGTDTTSHVWTISVLTSVQLESFQAELVPYEGVNVVWRTTSERDNLGFNVLRSLTEDGEYVKVNEKLIPARADHEYRFVDDSAKPGQVYYYKLEDVSVSGRKFQHDPVRLEVPLPRRFAVSQNYPNPFNPTTAIRFELPKATHVRIVVYNTLGREVKVLLDAQREAGYHVVRWDGTNNAGRAVGSGVYYYRVQAGDKQEVRKMTLLR